MNWTESIDSLIFIGLPYAALTLLAVGFLDRYRRHGEQISSHATQFLEPGGHFWAVVPLHYGLMTALLIHALCILTPSVMLSWNSSTWRLYCLELFTLSSGLLALVGLVLGMNRRRSSRRLRPVTGWPDWIVLSLVGFQIATGVLISVLKPWGTAWLSAAGGPYLRSVLLLQPDVGLVRGAPLLIKLHMINAFLLLALLPYTKLAHVLVVPVAYLWRAPLVFRWKDR